MSSKCHPQWRLGCPCSSFLSVLSHFTCEREVLCSPDCSLLIRRLPLLSSHRSWPSVHQGKPPRLGQQNKREACPALCTGAARTYSVLTVLERMKHSWAIPFFKKKISCDILIPFCTGTFLDFSPASHLKCFVSFPFSWIAYYEPRPTINNYDAVIEWKSRSLGYSGPWVRL